MYSTFIEIEISIPSNIKRRHTFFKYLRKKIHHFSIKNCGWNIKTLIYIDDVRWIPEDIKSYNKEVDRFKTFAREFYNNTSSFINKDNIQMSMIIYDDRYEMNDESYKWYPFNNFKEIQFVPTYGEYLRHCYEFKTYDYNKDILRSGFLLYFGRKIKTEPNGGPDTYVCYGREKLENGYIPKYKVGDIVDYDGKVAIVRQAPGPLYKDRSSFSFGNYEIDFISEDGYYSWSDLICRTILDEDLVPYDGEIPEFMKLLKKAVLKEDGLSLSIESNALEFDNFIYGHNVINDFDDIKENLMSILIKP